MPLNHEEAAVSIIVTGVSLGCVNSATRAWEAGFIRHPTHTLVVEVIRHAHGTSTVVIPVRPIPNGCTITVETDGAEPGVTLFTQAGHPEDFGLILDIEERVYGGIRLPRKRPEFKVTPLFVPSGVLYSVEDKLSDFPVRLIVKGDTTANPVERFGHIGTAAGADIRRQEGRKTVVRVAGEGDFEIPLRHEDGVRYTVLFDNTCPPDTPDAAARDGGGRGIAKLARTGEFVRPHSDFVLYYAVLDPPAARGLFDLVDDTADRGDGAVCNYSHLGRTTSLFPIV